MHTQREVYNFANKKEQMIKNSRSLIICLCMVFIGGIVYIISSVLRHDDENPLCPCVLCTNSRLPEDGEYLYNHYLFVLSIVWIAFMAILGYVVKERTERNVRKNHKKRNR